MQIFLAIPGDEQWHQPFRLFSVDHVQIKHGSHTRPFFLICTTD